MSKEVDPGYTLVLQLVVLVWSCAIYLGLSASSRASLFVGTQANRPPCEVDSRNKDEQAPEGKTKKKALLLIKE